MISIEIFSGLGSASIGLGNFIKISFALFILFEGFNTFTLSTKTFPDNIKFFILVLEKVEFKYCSSWFALFIMLIASIIHLSILLCGIEKFLIFREILFILTMFQNFNSTNNNIYKKSNLMSLIIISIILAILIIVCLVFLFKGLADNFSNMSYKQAENSQKNKISEIYFSYPNEAQFISSSLGADKELLLRYQYKGETLLIIVDINNKKIKNKIYFAGGSDWQVK